MNKLKNHKNNNTNGEIKQKIKLDGVGMISYAEQHKRKDIESPEQTLLIDAGTLPSLLSIKKTWPSPSPETTCGQWILNEDNLHIVPGQIH